MKRAIAYLFPLLLVFLMSAVALASLGEEKASSMDRASESDCNAMIDITIYINDSYYAAKLLDNESSAALIAQMPFTVAMRELNGNEKYHYLKQSFPANPELVGSIQAGDLMLYGSDCLVLFYMDLKSSYSYTRLGYIENPDGLAAALGAGEAQVSYALAQTGDR